jgi:hypothetical protein
MRFLLAMKTMTKISAFLILLISVAYFGGLVLGSEYSCKESSFAYCLGESTIKAKEQALRDLAEFKRGLGMQVQQD